jgi:uncharacterized RDD family membrane protein YckC
VRQELGRWLEGPGALRADQGGTPGERLGLPAVGPGSLATFGARLGAYVVDGVLANLLAGVPALFGVAIGGSARGLLVYGIFLLEELVLLSLVGQTVGMRLFGFGVARVPGGGRQRFSLILVRTVLLGLLLPVFFVDRDLRGLHDRAARTAPVRAGRGKARAAQP